MLDNKCSNCEELSKIIEKQTKRVSVLETIGAKMADALEMVNWEWISTTEVPETYANMIYSALEEWNERIENDE